MWIARLLTDTYTLTAEGTFYRSDRFGLSYTLSRPCILPTTSDSIVLLAGVNDFGEDVICYGRMRQRGSLADDGQYEIYNPKVDCWSIYRSDSFYKFTNLQHILEAKKRAAEEILLGQT